MKLMPLGAASLAVLITGCAASPELTSCLQPNRRVVVEVGGIKVKPPPKNKPAAKPGRENVLLKTFVQGDQAWEYGGAVLKDGGKTELDKLVKLVNEGTKRDTRPTKVGSVIVAGHIDRLESAQQDFPQRVFAEAVVIVWRVMDAHGPRSAPAPVGEPEAECGIAKAIAER